MQSRAALDYHNLDITISRRNGLYHVKAYSSMCGEAQSLLQFPYDYEEFRSRAEQVYTMLQQTQNGWKFENTKKVVREFGEDLFNSLIAGDVCKLYVKCVERAENMRKRTGLRIRLHIEDPELVRVPWEYLYDPDLRSFVAFYDSSPVIRYMDVLQSTKTPNVKLPLRLLCMISSPNDLPPLDVKHEKELVEKSLKPLRDERLIEITWLENNERFDDLQAYISRYEYHIFHFIGHGGFDYYASEGYICIPGNIGESIKVNAGLLTPLLRYQQRTLKLVFLNTCEGAKVDEDIFSSLVGGFMANGVLSVIAMQQKITDRAAILFSRHFYRSIADGKPIDAAVSAARIIMGGEQNMKLEWGVPVLYMRAETGELFKLQSKRLEAQVPTSVGGNNTSAVQLAHASVRRRRRTNRSSVQLKKEVNSEIGYYVDNYLDHKRFKRYTRGMRAASFFFFLTFDVIFVVYGIANWLHSPPLAVAVAILSLLLFLINCINNHELVGLCCSLLPGVFWSLVGIAYLHIQPIGVLAVSLLFAFFRFITFQPGGRKR